MVPVGSRIVPILGGVVRSCEKYSRTTMAKKGKDSGMKGDELRAMQAPLKERYRETPEAAVVTLRASGELGQEGLTCTVATGRALVEAGLHPATGGNGL